MRSPFFALVGVALAEAFGWAVVAGLSEMYTVGVPAEAARGLTLLLAALGAAGGVLAGAIAARGRGGGGSRGR